MTKIQIWASSRHSDKLRNSLCISLHKYVVDQPCNVVNIHFGSKVSIQMMTSFTKLLKKICIPLKFTRPNAKCNQMKLMKPNLTKQNLHYAESVVLKAVIMKSSVF